MTERPEKKDIAHELTDAVDSAELAEQDLEQVSGGNSNYEFNIYSNNDFYTGADITKLT